ncbi:HAD family hydrolase [Ruegeria atlantica]|uniref:HAD family hydrolase n=1 Tax=Ruegeria atlantica TaxID=81569 RepID=UPI001479E3CE|nr:HAD family phosphatase [Ruegeria atlantica]
MLQAILHHRGDARSVSSDQWLNLFDAEEFSAAIFDCDGTLVESAEAHLASMQSAAQDQGLDMSADWYHTRTGLDRRSLFLEFQASTRTAFDIDRACHVSIACFSDAVSLVRPITPVLCFAKALSKRGISLAVATNAERSVAELSLSAVGTRGLFGHLISISDGVRPKPSPELFKLAAKRLAVPQNDVLVIEDSPQGVQAAIDAGMSVLQLID